MDAYPNFAIVFVEKNQIIKKKFIKTSVVYGKKNVSNSKK